jgi:SAM-dependent methyltransferase
MLKIIKFIDHIRYFHQLVTGSRNEHELSLFQQRKKDISSYIGQKENLTVLDLANGWLRPQYRLLKAEGHHVIGIDMINRPQRKLIGCIYYIIGRIYLHHINFAKSDQIEDALVCGDVDYLPFPRDSFDLVTSIAAFEHFFHVDQVLSELQRVVRPGGVIWSGIHPYTTLSGGHNVKRAEIPLVSIPKGIDVWDHLRKKTIPEYKPLNKIRIQQYIDSFSRYFQILESYCYMREGEHLLTKEIEVELSDYSRDELTCGLLIIVAQK